MDIGAAHTLARSFSGDRATFLYSGRFHDEHTARLITLSEEVLTGLGDTRKLRGKLAFVMVEAYQNIVRHRSIVQGTGAKDPGRSLFLLRGITDGFAVQTVNRMDAGEAEALDALMRDLQRLDASELKERFLAGLKATTRSERGGAGLGLIEMARRSGQPLQYGSESLDERSCRFSLCVLLGNATLASLDPWRKELLEVHRIVVENDILVVQHGLPSAGAQEGVLRIVDHDIDDHPESVGLRSAAYLAALEWLEGVGGEGPRGTVLLAAAKGKYEIALSAVLSMGAAEKERMAVERLNGMDAQQRREHYRSLLLQHTKGARTPALGLADLARHAHGAVEMVTEPEGEGIRITLKVSV